MAVTGQREAQQISFQHEDDTRENTGVQKQNISGFSGLRKCVWQSAKWNVEGNAESGVRGVQYEGCIHNVHVKVQSDQLIVKFFGSM